MYHPFIAHHTINIVFSHRRRRGATSIVIISVLSCRCLVFLVAFCLGREKKQRRYLSSKYETNAGKKRISCGNYLYYLA
jgi:hypothetical protein